MKPVDKTDPKQTETLAFELDLRHSPAKVWRTLTEPELLAQWLLPVFGLELTPGAAFTLETQPVGGWDGVVRCKVLEVEPLKKLRYAWVVGAMDTVVTFTLAKTESGTRLSIVHSGFKPDQKQNWGGARYGWNLMGEKLIALLGRVS